MLRRLSAREENSDSRFGQKVLQNGGVSMLLRPAIKTRLDLTEHDQRNPNLVTVAKPLGQCGVALKQVHEAIRVERDCHFHLSQSICRWLAIVSSKGGSGIQPPVTSEKSALRIPV